MIITLTTNAFGGQVYWKGWIGNQFHTNSIQDINRDLNELADYCEKEIGTDPSRENTDYDGYIDLEELQDSYGPKSSISFEIRAERNRCCDCLCGWYNHQEVIGKKDDPRTLFSEIKRLLMDLTKFLGKQFHQSIQLLLRLR